MQDTKQQELTLIRQQLTAFEVTLVAPTNTPSLGMPTNLPMYSENSVTSLTNLSSTCMFDSVAQTTGVFARGKTEWPELPLMVTIC